MGDGFLVMRDGVRAAYRDHGGSGRGLVLLHGGGADLESMDQYAERLGDGRRTVGVRSPSMHDRVASRGIRRTSV